MSEEVIKKVRDIVQVFFGGSLTYKVYAHLVKPDEMVPLMQDLWMRPVPTVHAEGSAGIQIFKRTSRLRKDLRDCPEYRQRLQNGEKPAEQELEWVERTRLLYLLDNGGVLTDRDFGEVDLLIDDFTFPIDSDTTPERLAKHNGTKRVLQHLERFRPGCVILSHISSRYSGLTKAVLSKDLFKSESYKRLTDGDYIPHLVINRPDKHLLQQDLIW
jgi:hypothetical protein